MKKFEYKIITGSQMLSIEKDESILNDLGLEGWEVITMESMKTKKDSWGLKRQVYWLKREIKN